jgi:hypothetical protein
VRVAAGIGEKLEGWGFNFVELGNWHNLRWPRWSVGGTVCKDLGDVNLSDVWCRKGGDGGAGLADRLRVLAERLARDGFQVLTDQ